jgi:hypothetical protein
MGETPRSAPRSPARRHCFQFPRAGLRSPSAGLLNRFAQSRPEGPPTPITSALLKLRFTPRFQSAAVMGRAADLAAVVPGLGVAEGCAATD